MIYRDLERFGEDIRKTVQNAVDSQDFRKLNQTITNTVNDAVGAVSRNIKSVQAVNRRPKPPVLYRQVTSVQVRGTVTTVLGAVIGGMCSTAFLFFAVTAWLAGGYGIPEIAVMALFLSMGVAGFVICGCGTGIRARIRRFRTYIRVLGKREYCNIQELSKAVKKNARYVARDLEDMFSRGWFLQGHLDEQRTCLIVSDGMYRQYLQAEAQRKQIEREAEASGLDRQDERESEASGLGGTKLPPEVQRVIVEGDTYIRKIHACNDAIHGEEISAKISRMELLVNRIFHRVEQNPESVDDIHKLMEYYLPTTVKLLEAYQEMEAQPVAGENIRSSKKEIEATLDTLNVAFEKLLDGMFQETAWDVSSDISVLQTLLAQEGLTDDGLRK
ncbi:MAG: hypothetical protein HFG88_11085 [Dorea sp.]|nr:hypothetical protein [Dorea sp.]